MNSRIHPIVLGARRVLVTAVLLVCVPAAAGQVGVLNTVVRSDHPDPARRFAGMFSSAAEASISEDGVVVFRAGGPVPGERAYWSLATGTPQRILSTVLPAFGVPDAMFTLGQISTPVAVGPGGNALIAAGWRDSSNTFGSGVWLGGSSPLVPLVLSGQPAPGQPDGVSLSSVRSRASFQGDRLALRLSFTGENVVPLVRDEAIYAGSPGALQHIATLGATLPGVPDGSQLVTFGSHSPTVADDGTVAFWGRSSQGSDESNIRGVWTHRNGILSPLFVQGQPAPLPGGPVSSHPMGFSANRHGAVAVAGATAGFGHIFVSESTGVSTVLSVPAGVQSNPHPYRTPSSPLINDRGDVFFRAQLRDGAESALWALQSGQVREVLRVGQTVSGPAGTASVSFGIFADVGEQVMQVRWSSNALGQLVIADHTNSFDASTEAPNQIIVWDPALGPSLIAKTGGPMTLGPGDVRTVASLRLPWGSSGGDGRVTALSDTGVLVFTAYFTDGTSGIFTVTVPAPGAIALLPGLYWLTARRRR